MKKQFLMSSLLISSLAFSQVGIRTANPQQTFHIDGAKDNPTTGAPSAAQQANDFVVTSTGNAGIGTTAPTNTLDVNGTARIRTANQGVGTTVLSPLYANNTGVVVKSANYGDVRSATVTVASGATGAFITVAANTGLYKAVVTTANGCSLYASAEFFISSNAGNNYYGLAGIDGLVVTANNKPTFTQTAITSVGVTWTGVPACAADGSDSTALNYTLTTPSGGVVNIVNNSNVSRTYTITLTQLGS